MSFPAPNGLQFGASGQTISWNHELDTAKLDHGWFCRCGLKCSSKGKLTAHIKNFTEDRSFNCKLCPSYTGSFATVANLYRHYEKCHEITHRGWVGCGDCGAVFKTRLEQSRHRAAFHDDDHGQSPYCPTKSCKASGNQGKITDPASSKTSENNEGQFKCECGKVFASKEYLNRHQRYKMKMFRCPYCNKNFGQWYNLKNHLASKHAGEYHPESFECGKCGHVFPNIDHVVAHYRAMHGQRLY